MKSKLFKALFILFSALTFLMPSESFAHVEPVVDIPVVEISYFSSTDTLIFFEKYYSGTRTIQLIPGQIYNTFTDASGFIYMQNAKSPGTGTNCPSPGVNVYQYEPIVIEEWEVIEGKESVASISGSSGSWIFVKVAKPSNN